MREGERDKERQGGAGKRPTEVLPGWFESGGGNYRVETRRTRGAWG